MATSEVVLHLVHLHFREIRAKNNVSKNFCVFVVFYSQHPLINIIQYMEVRGCKRQDVPEGSATATAAPSAGGSKHAAPQPKNRDGFRMFHCHKRRLTHQKSRLMSPTSALLRVHADEKFISIELRAPLRAKRGRRRVKRGKRSLYLYTAADCRFVSLRFRSWTLLDRKPPCCW